MYMLRAVWTGESDFIYFFKKKYTKKHSKQGFCKIILPKSLIFNKNGLKKMKDLKKNIAIIAIAMMVVFPFAPAIGAKKDAPPIPGGAIREICYLPGSGMYLGRAITCPPGIPAGSVIMPGGVIIPPGETPPIYPSPKNPGSSLG